MRHSRLYLAIGGLLGLAPAAALMSTQALAQAGSAEQLEEVVVTGSRIQRADLAGANPVSVIDSAQLESMSLTSIGDVLRQAPFSAGGAVNTQVNNGGSGAVNFSLRGLGSPRTLVLVNGRRVVPSGLGANSVVDLNNIPMNMIERVEVLKDGASAVYGSDAVAGVVNIITRQDFEGAEINVTSGVTSENDGEENTAEFSFGTTSDRGNFVVNGYWTEQKPIWAGDREYSEVEVWYHPIWDPEGVEDGGSSAPPWGFYGTPDGPVTRGEEYGDFRPYENSDAYNYAPANYTQTPSERWGFSAFGNYELGDFGQLQNVELNGEVMYTRRESQRLIAPEPLAPLVFFGTPAPYSPDNYYNANFGPTDADGNPYEIADWRRRMEETGGRDQRHDTNTHQITAGISGDFGEWIWDGSVFFGENNASVTDLGYFQLERVGEAVGPTYMDDAGNLQCSSDGTADGVIAGCVPLNVFGEPGTDSAITDEMLQYISGNYVTLTQGGNELKGVQFNTSGPVMDLPAGELGAAFGVERRLASGYSQPDSLQLLGTSTAGRSQATEGGYSVNEAYVELAVPLLAELPGVDMLELSLASRYSDYNTFGSTTNSKIGLRWSVNDELTFRGTVSEAFRAPSIPDLYAGQYDTFPQVGDPCASDPTPSCVADGVPEEGYDNSSITQLPTLQGGNPDLSPEEADIFTMGAVYEPGMIEGLSLTLDYWETEVENAISTLGPQVILDDCHATGKNCDLIDRWGPGSGATVGDIRFIHNVNTNVGGVDASGVDFSARYQMPTTDYGTFRFNYDLAYMDNYEKELSSGDIVQHAGWFRDNQDGNFPEWRWNFSTMWSMGNWDASYTARYIGEVTELLNKSIHPGDELREVDSQMVHDIQGSYSLDDYNTRITLGVDNVADEQPPFAYSGFNDNTDPRTYETVGRFYYGRVTLSF
ncbi:MAG: TonB-dependent receptor [Pseudohongiellaceae bacterium]